MISQSVQFCSGHGQHHTANPDAKHPKPYIPSSMASIMQMMADPKPVPKEKGQWVIFSDDTGVHGRNAEHLRSTGALFYALWGDIDEAQGVTAQDVLSRTAFGATDAETHVYTSRSATEENQKCRIIVPLAEPVNAVTFEIMQEVLNNKLESEGLIPDRATQTCNQLCYLPNRGEFYWSGSLDSLDSYDTLHPDRWAKEVAAIKDEIRQAQIIVQAAKPKPRPNLLNATQSGIVEKILQAYDGQLVDILKGEGYRGSSRKLLCPSSTSGSLGVTILERDGKQVCYSHHGATSDKLSNQNHNGHSLDVVDVICELWHGGDFSKMIAVEAENLDGEANKQRQIEHAKEQDRIKAAAEFENFSTSAAKPEPLKDQQTEKADVLSPPGIAGDICRLIAARARRDRPELYPLASLHMLALVSSARPTVYTSKLNIITLGIASTAAGKETAQDVIKKLASECYLSGHIHSDMGSFREMIINLIDGDGKNLYIMDEVHSTLDSMRSKNAATYETKTEAEILKMTTTGLYTFRGAEKRSLVPFFEKDLAAVSNRLSELPDGDTGDKFKMLTRTKAKLERQIKHIHEGWPDPFVSIMGHSVPEKLDKFASSADNIASGFIGRSLVVRCPEGAEPLRLDLDTAEANILQADISHRLARIKGSTSLITATDEADQYLRDRSAHFEEEEQRNCEYLGAIYRRASEHLFKVAGLLAIESGEIKIEHARYADALVTSSIYDIGYLIQQAMAKGEGASTQAVTNAAKLKILKQSKPKSGATLTALKKAVTRSTQWQDAQAKYKDGDLFDDLITELIQKEQLEFIDDGRRKRYRTK